MALELDIDINTDILHVRAKGLRSSDSVLTITKKIMEVCDMHNRTKVLVDVRDLKGRLGTLDSHHVAAEEFPKIKGIKLYQVAIVDDDVTEGGVYPFETFAQKQGFNMKLFGSVVKAIDWLRE